MFKSAVLVILSVSEGRYSNPYSVPSISASHPFPLLVKTIRRLKNYNLSRKQLEVIVKHHDNKKRLKESLEIINENLI